MKKVLSSVLCILMVLAVFSGCIPQQSGGESTEETTLLQSAPSLRVGYARADITPTVPVPLGGMSNSLVGGSSSDRFFTNVRDPLYAVCVALTDANGTTVLLFEVDLQNSRHTYLLPCKMAIAKATGVSGNNIMITSTHNHSGPDVNSSEAVIEDYIAYLADRMAEAAVAAMEDRKPAQMYTAATRLENMNFVRHYLLKDGTKTGWASPATAAYKAGKIAGYAVEADNEMQLIQFTREGGKDIVLMNWQAHPSGHGEYEYSVLSDIEPIRKEIESQLDCHFAYFLGAAGNLNSESKILEDMRYPNYEERGKALAQYAADALSEAQPARIGNIQITWKDYPGILRADETKTRLIQLYAFSLGDAAFITAPYEMFCENGRDIKDNSPFEMTFIATCANGAMGYLPSIATFDYDSYEGTGTNFIPGTAEKLVTEYISMLNQIHKAN